MSERAITTKERVIMDLIYDNARGDPDDLADRIIAALARRDIVSSRTKTAHLVISHSTS